MEILHGKDCNSWYICDNINKSREENKMSDVLYNYFYWGNFNQNIQRLAEMSPEKWSHKGKTDNSILKNYLEYTFIKLKSEGKVIENNEYCLFNTGLFTKQYDEIYVYAEKENNEYVFKTFSTEYDLGNISIMDLPKRADYFYQPELLIFNPNLKLNVQYDHILEDEENKRRLTNIKKKNPTADVNAMLRGSIELVKKKIASNYKLAVPQYYNGNIQLLLPLYLEERNTPNLALVVSKNEKMNYYQAHTCLTMEMAYNNARLITRPESNWLIP